MHRNCNSSPCYSRHLISISRFRAGRKTTRRGENVLPYTQCRLLQTCALGKRECEGSCPSILHIALPGRRLIVILSSWSVRNRSISTPTHTTMCCWRAPFPYTLPPLAPHPLFVPLPCSRTPLPRHNTSIDFSRPPHPLHLSHPTRDHSNTLQPQSHGYYEIRSLLALTLSRQPVSGPTALLNTACRTTTPLRAAPSAALEAPPTVNSVVSAGLSEASGGLSHWIRPLLGTSRAPPLSPLLPLRCQPPPQAAVGITER